MRGRDVGALLGLDVLADGRRARAGRGLGRPDDPRGRAAHARAPAAAPRFGMSAAAPCRCCGSCSRRSITVTPTPPSTSRDSTPKPRTSRPPSDGRSTVMTVGARWPRSDATAGCEIGGRHGSAQPITPLGPLAARRSRAVPGRGGSVITDGPDCLRERPARVADRADRPGSPRSATSTTTSSAPLTSAAIPLPPDRTAELDAGACRCRVRRRRRTGDGRRRRRSRPR